MESSSIPVPSSRQNKRVYETKRDTQCETHGEFLMAFFCIRGTNGTSEATGYWPVYRVFFLANSSKCIFLKMSMNRNIETGHQVYDTLLCTCRVITPGKVIETPCTYVPTCLAKALGSLPTHSVCHLQHRGTSLLTSHHQYFISLS